MKKWFVGLMMLLALVLILGVATAEGEKEVTFFCFSCRENRTGTISDTYEYFDQDAHIQRIICKVCNYKGMSIRSAHTETKAATCQSPAYCDVCKSYYGDPAEHNWGAWTADPMTHKRTCQTPDCGAVDEGRHTSEPKATCKTPQTCAICNVQYIDSTNHVGEVVTDYWYDSESQHVMQKSCISCGHVISANNEAHTETTAATCQSPAYCAVCKSSYGDPDPDAHIGEATTTYEKTSETQHTPTTTYSICKHTVTGTPESHTETTAATCTDAAYCAVCKSNYGSTNPNNHVGDTLTWYEKTSETQHTAEITYAVCGHKVAGEPTDHTETTAATCTKAAYCAVCKSSYGDPDPNAHDLVQHEAQAPTCFRVGWTAYEACQREGCGYTTYEEIPRLVHWYAEWMPNTDATHTAACRQGCRHDGNVPCTLFTYQMKSADQAVEVTLCPVCGEVSDGTRLMLAEAAAKAVTGKLPAGEIVVRMGTLESGEVLMSVAFEIGGKLTQPTGQVKLTLPAELLAGYTLSLLSEDGTETELTDVQEASFVLDFDANPSPVRVIRLVPAA